jgi:hypothetical protein
MHRTVLSPSEQHSKRLLAKFEASDDTAPVLHPLTKYERLVSQCSPVTSVQGSLPGCNRHLFPPILCHRPWIETGEIRGVVNGDDPAYLSLVRHGSWGYPPCRCFTRGQRSSPASESCKHLSTTLKGVISAESAFKALALAIRQAIERTGGNDIPSTKGVL